MPGGSISNARNGGQQGVRRLHFCCAFLLLDGCLNPGNLLVQPSDMRLQRALDRLVLTVFQGFLSRCLSWPHGSRRLSQWPNGSCSGDQRGSSACICIAVVYSWISFASILSVFAQSPLQWAKRSLYSHGRGVQGRLLFVKWRPKLFHSPHWLRIQPHPTHLLHGSTFSVPGSALAARMLDGRLEKQRGPSGHTRYVY